MSDLYESTRGDSAYQMWKNKYRIEGNLSPTGKGYAEVDDFTFVARRLWELNKKVELI